MMRPTLLALCLTLAGPPAGAAEGRGTWRYTAPSFGGDEATLVYGNDAMVLRCKAGSRHMSLSVPARQARQWSSVTLVAGEAQSRRVGHAEPAGEGVIVEAPMKVDNRALSAFRDGEPLSVVVGEAQTDVPPAAREIVEAFFETCGEPY